MIRRLITSLILALSPMLAHATFDHALLDKLLRSHVVSIERGASTQVDYAAFSQDHVFLKRYLDALATVQRSEFDSWDKKAQLAFLINAYNAWTVELILTKYPNIKSIKDLGSFLQSPWKIHFIPLLGETRSLDEIEHGLIRKSDRYNDSRIHFAVNCASVGCPALRAEAYVAEKLDTQLAEATFNFLADRSRNRFDNTTLWVSPIFKWYREDFERNGDTLSKWLTTQAKALRLSEAQARALADGQISIGFLDYDWRLNRKQ